MIFIFMITLLFIGTSITISSSSWIIAWVGMEMNLLGFIPLINQKKTASAEAAMKYFIIQAISSSLFIMSSTLLPNNLFSLTPLTLLTLMSLLLKIGAAPLHFWLFPMVDFLSWNTLLLLLTWQKIAPLFMMYPLQFNFLTPFVILNAIIGSTLMFSQTSMKKMLTYSSLTHLGWMMFSLLSCSHTLPIYLFIYATSTMIMTLILNKFNTSNFSQIMTLPLQPKILIMINFLSLMGFPPLSGFFPKLLVLNSVPYNTTLLILSMILIFSSFISMFSYTRSFIYSFPSKSNFLMNNYPHLNNLPMTSLLPLLTPILLILLN